ncbi:MAG: NAD-dependent epimerase/dehydratase family protein [Spirochaetaceae bacterium]|nr:NAD-dependent epimerase/dehydratase family protein [Spirochaetaceae bacterium]
MKLLITGAGGFLGQYVVSEAVRRSHDVKVLLRPATKTIPKSWEEHPKIEIVKADLRSSKGLVEIVSGVDCVIHLAASKAGDLYEQLGGTVIATENLLNAMTEAGINRITMTSSFSVYEYLKRLTWSSIDESSPLAINRLDRDEYCQTKLLQEQITTNYAEKKGWQCTILRPGVIFGRDNLWTARLGMQAGSRLWISTGLFAKLPLTYVENCAEAIVMASEQTGSEKITILNIVDGKSPTQLSYMRELRKNMSSKPLILPVLWIFMRFLARLAWLVNLFFFKGTAKIPGLFVPSRIHARSKPLFYKNKKIVTQLNWKPRFSWKEGIQRAVSDDELTLIPNQMEKETLASAEKKT